MGKLDWKAVDLAVEGASAVPEKQKKWRIGLYMVHGGGPVLGETLYDTAEAAAARISEIEKWFRGNIREGVPPELLTVRALTCRVRWIDVVQATPIEVDDV